MKYILIFISLFFVTLLANGQGRESYQIAHDVTLDNPERYASYDCVSLLDSTDVTIQPNGCSSYIIRRIVKVMNKRGAIAHRTLKESYDPWITHAQFYRVTIYKANGDVFNLDITQQLYNISPACLWHQGARQILMEVGHLDPGDIIDYRINLKSLSSAPFTTAQTNPFRSIPLISGQPFHEIAPFESPIPIARKVYKVHIPMEKKMLFRQIPEGCISSSCYENDMKTYTFIRTNIQPTQPSNKERLLADTKVMYNKLAKTWTLNPDSSQTLRIQMELDLQSQTDTTGIFKKSLFVYNPQYQELSINKAYIRLTDGTTHLISQKNLVECLPHAAMNTFDYNHLKEQVLFLPETDHIQNICLDYTIHTQADYQAELDLFEQIYQSSPVKRYTISITVPKHKPLSYALANYSVRPSIKQMNGMCTTQWVFSYLPEIQSISNPKKPYLTATTYRSQADALATFSDQFEMEENMQLLTIAEGLIEEIEDEVEQVKAIHKYVLDHFDNLTLPLSLAAYRIRPSEQVISSAYGTEAEKANLLSGLLNHAGFIAEPVAMYADENCKGLGMKGISQLFVSCKVGKDYYLLSPTSATLIRPTEKRPFTLFSVHQGTALLNYRSSAGK